MALGCGARTAKYTLCFFNILVLLAGLAILGVGIWLLADETASKYFDIIRADTSDGLVRGACISLIIVGALASFIAFMGCCGAARESKCLLLSYAITLGCILVLQLVAGIVAVVFRNDIEKNLASSMNNTVQTKYGVPSNEAVTDAWDIMQIEFECCGAINGPSEWESSAWIGTLNSTSTQTVPTSCCVLTSKDINNPNPVNVTACYEAGSNTSLPNANIYVHTKGCDPAFYDWIRSHLAIILGVAFGLAFIQLGGSLFACLVVSSINNSGYEYV